MTELERRAMMGDRKAQEECTRRRILLPCWKCGGQAEANELQTGGKPLYAVACQKHYCGAYGAGSSSVQKAIEFWNTRPAPPVGWISVKEGVPEEKQRVIVRCSTIGTTVGCILWGEWMTDLGNRCSDVTHWMSLPEPPKEDA